MRENVLKDKMIFDDTDLDMNEITKKSNNIDKAILRELKADKKIQNRIENRLKKQKEDHINFGTRGNKGNLPKGIKKKR